MLSGYLWPVASWQEFVSGDFIAATDDITISPRKSCLLILLLIHIYLK